MTKTQCDQFAKKWETTPIYTSNSKVSLGGFTKSWICERIVIGHRYTFSITYTKNGMMYSDSWIYDLTTPYPDYQRPDDIAISNPENEDAHEDKSDNSQNELEDSLKKFDEKFRDDSLNKWTEYNEHKLGLK